MVDGTGMGRLAVEPILQDEDKERNKNGYSCCVIPILVASFLFFNWNYESVTSTSVSGSVCRCVVASFYVFSSRFQMI